jgi:hypothetical protein
MHVHLPKPLHGWRAFVGEVGIIVLGVLIALGAEQAIQGVHDRQVAAQSRRDVRDEVGWDIGFYRSRLVESSCVASRLSELSEIVEQGDVPKDKVRWVSRPLVFAPFTERWRAVTSSARTALFPPVEQGRLDAIYALFQAMEQTSRNEQDAWTTLNTIGRLNGPIDPASRFSVLRALQQARETDADIRVAGYYALFHARKLGISSSPETAPRLGDVHPICLPLSTRPEQAEKVLQRRLPH